MKKIQQITIILFVGFIFTLFGLNILEKDKSFSENENRSLTKLPKFSLNELFFNNYTSSFETYFTDQFIYRDFWIPVKAISEQMMLKQENNSIYFGEDHYLFGRFNTYDENQMNRSIKAIQNFILSTNANVKVMLVPTAVEIKKQYLPSTTYDINQKELIEKIYQYFPENTVNVYDTLLNHTSEYIYYKTDHHWTTLGAYYGYQSLIESLGFKANTLDEYKKTFVSENFKGTYYSKAGTFWYPSDGILRFDYLHQGDISVEYEGDGVYYDSMYKEENLAKKDKYTYFLDGNHSQTEISSYVSEGKNVLVIKDSYAHNLVPFLVDHYANVHMLDLRYYRGSVSEYMELNQIDDVVILYNIETFVSDANIPTLR